MTDGSFVGRRHLLLLTLDTLRHDVAVEALDRGRTPNLGALLPDGAWEERHTPGSFTFAAHAAFFAGFLPTPVTPGPHVRSVALAFPGSETIGPATTVLEGGDIVEGLRGHGYRSICIGGVGFFNPATALGARLPSLFDDARWSPAMGVTDPHSFEHQLDALEAALAQIPDHELVFAFVNVSALHQPNCIFSTGATEDSPETQGDALAYVDGHVPRLVQLLRSRGAWRCILTSDHGTAYGEDGRVGHRHAGPEVWTVPYAELDLEPTPTTEAER